MLPLSIYGTLSDSVHNVHITTQDLKTGAQLLCQVAFVYLVYLVKWLPCICIIVLLKLIFIIKVVQNLTFQTELPHIESGQKHGITPIPAYILAHLNVEAEYLLWRSLIPEWHLLHCITQAAWQLLGHQEVDLLASLHISQCQQYYPLRNLLHL